MCWRDDLSPLERQTLFEEDRTRFRLRQGQVRVGSKVYLDSYEGRRYYRRSTIRTLAGPMDTTEVKLPVGTRVKFEALPQEIREQFNLRAAEPRATVIRKHGGEVGFSFGKRGGKEKKYFPLQNSFSVLFVVTKLP